MTYLVNKSTDDLRVTLIGRVVPAGERLDLGDSVDPGVLDALAQNHNLGVFADDGTPHVAPAPDFSPKKIDLSWMTAEAQESGPVAPSTPATAAAPQSAPQTVSVAVPAGEHVELVPDAPAGGSAQ